MMPAGFARMGVPGAGRPRPCARHGRQRGQALAEFLVMAAALVPLFLLIPMLGKYQDIASQVDAASRYVAFESMTRNDSQNSWKPPAELAEEVRRRYFGHAGTPIKTGDKAGNVDAHRNPFWRGPAGSSLIADFNADVSVSFGPQRGASHDDAFTGASDGQPFNGAAGTSEGPKTAQMLGLNARGIYTANVGVRLAKLPEGLAAYAPLDTIDLSMTRHTSVLFDGWQAKNPEQVESRIDHGILVPATALRKLAPVVELGVLVGEGGQMHGPKLGKLDFWRDVVPADRLK